VGTVSLESFRADVERLRAEAVAALGAAAADAALEQARVEFAGARSGRLKAIQKLLGGLDAADRPEAGRLFNEAKGAITAALDAAQVRLAGAAAEAAAIDVTLPGEPFRLGHVHPITQTIRRVQEIMARLGFESVDGPEVEDQWHNFEALAIGAEHPARDPLDNFYLAVAQGADPLLLRSQTSTVQIRVMERRKPPLRIVSLGRVYRPDTADATHYPMFHQVEGLLVEPGATMADLKGVLRFLASSFLGGDVHVRFRPSFFPFPGGGLRLRLRARRGADRRPPLRRGRHPRLLPQRRPLSRAVLGSLRVFVRRDGAARTDRLRARLPGR
jgi:phenylalanyl-tRNA synthetase alpha chain